MHWRAFLILLLGAAGAVLPGGCGPASSSVSGEVTVDGQPLGTGVIAYVSAEGTGPPATALVQTGKYELRTTPGNKRVQISWPAVVGQRKAYDGPDAPLLDISEERLPPRYNSGTELTFEVKAGSNTKDWVLQSKAR
jgi:hypothetical protein